MDLFKLKFYLEVYVSTMVLSKPILVAVDLLRGYEVTNFSLIIWSVLLVINYQYNETFDYILKKWGWKKKDD